MQEYLLEKETGRIVVADGWEIRRDNDYVGPIFFQHYDFALGCEGYKSNVQFTEGFGTWSELITKYQFIDFYTALRLRQLQSTCRP